MSDYLILGCGYTGSRVARTLIAAGHRVICTNRQPAQIEGALNLALDIDDPASLQQVGLHLTPQCTVLNSISATHRTADLLQALVPLQPKRMLYISTTGVYGTAQSVDEHTAPEPHGEKDILRLETESLIAAGPWSSLVLRPAAIYGPGRGVHTAARSGIFRPPPGGDRIVSRIHVDDLADHVIAGLEADLVGAFPVADEEPCPSSVVAAFAFQLMGVPFQTANREATLRDERKVGRRVDGSAIRMALGLALRYPTYREGVAACLEAEGPWPR